MQLPAYLYVVTCLPICSYLPTYMQVPAYLYVGTCLHICRYLPNYLWVPAYLYVGTCLPICSYLPTYMQVPAYLYVGTCLPTTCHVLHQSIVCVKERKIQCALELTKFDSSHVHRHHVPSEHFSAFTIFEKDDFCNFFVRF